ncbi:MAG: tyrosine-type recombinase/integrase [Promethearchaeota archaeon]
MKRLTLERDLKIKIEENKYFLRIKIYIGEDMEKVLKCMQYIKNKSRSKNFKHWQYLQCFGIFIKYLQKLGYSYKDFQNLSYEDRNLIYSNFINALENGEITQEVGKNKGKPYAKSSIRNVFQSRVQAILNKALNLRVRQPKFSVKTGTTEKHKNKIVLTQEICKMIYDRIESKTMKLLFIFHLNTGLRFSDLEQDFRIHEDSEGYWFLEEVETIKDEIFIPFIPLSKEFKELTLEYYGKKPPSTDILFKSRNGTPIARRSYNLRLEAILEELIELGIIEENTTISSHSVRKFFYNQWLRIGDVQLAEYMMGHTRGIEIGLVYSQYQIMEHYKQIEEHFLISTTIIDKTDEQIEELKDQMKQKDIQIEKLKESIKENEKNLKQWQIKLQYALKLINERQ